MATPRCLNCDRPLGEADRFCPECGQRTSTARLTVRDLVRELMHSFVDVERSPLAFARALAARPGVVAREYVEGRRRRHYGPFATLAVLVGATALAINLSGYQVLSQDGLPSAPTQLLERHFNLLLLVQLLLLGAICAALFRDARLTWPEHMVLVAYLLGVRAVVLAFIATVAYGVSARSPGPVQTTLFWGAWYLYFGWAASQFY